MVVLSALIASLISATMVGGAVFVLVSAFRPSKPEGHYFGDGTDEMFEAMREVDAITPAVEPFLAARLPPRVEQPYPVRFDRPIYFHGPPELPIKLALSTRMVTLPDGKKVSEEFLRDPDGQMVDREWEEEGETT